MAHPPRTECERTILDNAIRARAVEHRDEVNDLLARVDQQIEDVRAPRRPNARVARSAQKTSACAGSSSSVVRYAFQPRSACASGAAQAPHLEDGTFGVSM
jgi:hypothetical protein